MSNVSFDCSTFPLSLSRYVQWSIRLRYSLSVTKPVCQMVHSIIALSIYHSAYMSDVLFNNSSLPLSLSLHVGCSIRIQDVPSVTKPVCQLFHSTTVISLCHSACMSNGPFDISTLHLPLRLYVKWSIRIQCLPSVFQPRYRLQY